ncbi:5-dehydro-2-deoxygluconokinase [compost metagenome]
MFHVTALGEVLIDFTPTGTDGNGFPTYTSNPGGAPANVLAGLARWGRSTAFLGSVGEDHFGHFLEEVLQECGIDTRGLRFSQEASTTLAFVHLDNSGDRSFSFYRNPGADQLLAKEDVDIDVIEQSTIFHFGSVSLTHEPSASATLMAAEHAKQSGRMVSYDPNLRVNLWSSLEQAKERILQGFQYADIVKLSEEELEFLTGTTDLELGTASLREAYGTSIILVSLGPAGCFVRIGELTDRVAGYPVTVVDTTGAGDCFFAGFLYQLLESDKPLFELSLDEVAAMAAFANASGALTTTRLGAIPSIPTLSEIISLMASHTN